MSFDTRRWLVTTIAGFCCLGIWLLASAAHPVVVIPEEIKAILFAVALGALGLAQWTGYKAVAVVNEILNYDPAKKS